jgi:hypothetical protein
VPREERPIVDYDDLADYEGTPWLTALANFCLAVGLFVGAYAVIFLGSPSTPLTAPVEPTGVSWPTTTAVSGHPRQAGGPGRPRSCTTDKTNSEAAIPIRP